ncbi:MAG: NADH-quinone oxidoreductase subunit N [Acidobacteria bacterium]|nr:NADH-quinone oxidoreductase subunit N [Acidobacteriota bacterium]
MMDILGSLFSWLPVELWIMRPELCLTLAAFLTLIFSVARRAFQPRWLGYFSIAVTAAVGAPLLDLFRRTTELPGQEFVAWNGMFVVDSFAVFFKVLFLLAAILTMLMSIRYLDVEKAHTGEYYALIMFAVVGMMFMVSARDLILLFVGLETMSISTYILAGYLKRDRRSNESALKYFLLGSFSTGIFLYGISLVYAVTGSTHLRVISDAIAEGLVNHPLLVLGLILMIVALGFKIAAVPFHMWVPDTYEGAPTTITAFFSTAVKAAGFAIVLRILVEGMLSARMHWAPLVVILSAASMIIGTLGALLQENVKRLLAYSSITHVGYLLMGVLAVQRGADTGARGMVAIAVYLLAYTFMNMGAFGLVVALRREGLVGDQVDDFTGLARRAPLAAFSMLVFMLSLGGIPATAGFIGKWYLFGAAIKADYVWLAVLAVLASATSLYYYLRVVVRMYMGEAEEEGGLRPSGALASALVISLVFTILMGLYPQPFIWLAQHVVLY